MKLSQLDRTLQRLEELAAEEQRASLLIITPEIEARAMEELKVWRKEINARHVEERHRQVAMLAQMGITPSLATRNYLLGPYREEEE